MAYEPERRKVVEEEETVDEGRTSGERHRIIDDRPVADNTTEVVEERKAPRGRRIVEERPPIMDDRIATRRVERTRYVEDPVEHRRFQLHRATELIYAAFGVLESLIAIRVVLKLLAANPQNLFAQLIYGITEPFVLPFEGLFVTPQAGGVILELSSIVAIFVYMLIAYGLVRLIWLLFDHPAGRTRIY